MTLFPGPAGSPRPRGIPTPSVPLGGKMPGSSRMTATRSGIRNGACNPLRFIWRGMARTGLTAACAARGLGGGTGRSGNRMASPIIAPCPAKEGATVHGFRVRPETPIPSNRSASSNPLVS
jgi:hypothetical protein